MVNYCSFVTNVMKSQIKLNGEQVIPFVNLVNEICEIGFLPEDQWVGEWLMEPRQFLDDKSPMQLINEDTNYSGAMSKVWDLIMLIEKDEVDAWEPLDYRKAQSKN